jgi:hypothetical protein
MTRSEPYLINIRVAEIFFWGNSFPNGRSCSVFNHEKKLHDYGEPNNRARNEEDSFRIEYLFVQIILKPVK